MHRDDDQRFIESFERIVEYGRAVYGWSVERTSGRDSCAVWDDKQIFINTRCSRESQLYTLLHEIGHVIVANELDHTFKFVYSTKYVRPDSRESKTKRHRVCVVEEECAAWDRGYTLSVQLEMPIDKKRFDAFKTRALLSYMRAIDD